MKHLLITGLLLASSNVFASKLVNINGFTNGTLESARAQIVKVNAVSHEATKKVLVLKGKGKTAQEVRENAVAQALHTVCPFFDEGVSIGLDSKDDAGAQTAAQTLLEDSSAGEEDFNTLFNALKTANKQIGVEVYSGQASGNNTVGNVLGIYDVKNNEIAVFANTNCGSDD